MPSPSISGCIRSPAASWPSGDASAVESPSRAVPIAVIAPPPGVRTRSPAKRSSPSCGRPSRPTNVMSMKAGTATTTSTLMAQTLSGCAASGQTTYRRGVDRLPDRPHNRAEPGAGTADVALDGGSDRILRVGAHRGRRGAPALLERAQPRRPGLVPGRERPIAAGTGQRGGVAEQRRDVLEIEQREAERLVALQQQVRNSTRTRQPRADGLRRGLAVQVVLVTDPDPELAQQLAGRGRSILEHRRR